MKNVEELIEDLKQVDNVYICAGDAMFFVEKQEVLNELARLVPKCKLTCKLTCNLCVSQIKSYKADYSITEAGGGKFMSIKNIENETTLPDFPIDETDGIEF